MHSPFFVYAGLGLLAIVALGYALGLKPREGPTPIGEIVVVAGAAAVVACVLGYPIALLPIAIAVLAMLRERVR